MRCCRLANAWPDNVALGRSRVTQTSAEIPEGARDAAVRGRPGELLEVVEEDLPLLVVVPRVNMLLSAS
eukprot:8579953-Pyramimonas_sp.AAC.1